MSNQKWVSTMDKEIWGKYMQQAAAGKLGVGFVEGTLVGPTEAFTAPDINALQWIHTPWKDASHPVIITVYKTSSDKKAATMYRSLKTSDWKDWPSNFPDRNTYENVDHCGIKTSGSPGLAVWTQDPEQYRGSFVVVMTGGTGGATAFNAGLDEGHTYASDIYMAVDNSVKEEGGSPEK